MRDSMRSEEFLDLLAKAMKMIVEKPRREKAKKEQKEDENGNAERER